ncbi:roadblock/LC7 domain-containing protein [Salinibacterium sp. SYSU T00001]|uniref:roadblock/LC7 domain-containing protein n=1 Tax=Homoserinimonas sedimenticola TaxID=2986805 RepID=UPI00223679F4|nr:roadblock/LC7 domain-containing protein [Salinibacterium sedimenticola]MCW4386214.1 roadblock/LC7 domain-containing protein [Salinibacterium sedimenticola]
MTDTAELMPPHRDPHTVDIAHRALAVLGELSPSLGIAVVLTDDGFEVARHPRRDSADQRLASMASSLQALSEAIVRELRLGAPGYVIIEATEGHVLLRRVPGRQMVLAAVFDSDESVGKAISVSRKVAEDFSAAI